MDTTFITIHGMLFCDESRGTWLKPTDLSEDAHILYSSDSIVDILGHTPDEVVNKSVWDFFHPDEVPIAQQLHGRSVRLDKASVLSYCRIKNRQGDWVGCECCFSIVYDVMVCCTSIYRQGLNSQSKQTNHRNSYISDPRL
jgi:PAS domain-containing protein